MKKRLRVLIAAMCVLALAVTPAFAAWGDTSSGEMTATGEQIVEVTDGGNVIGKKINTFKLDDRYTYKSLTPDPGKTTLTMSKSNLQNIVRDTLLPQWSGVAASIFRDQAGQLVDLYGYEDNGDRMSQAGFDAYFNMGPSGNNTYKDEVWSCYHLNHKLGQASPSHAGDPGWDQFTVSGIKQISSLNDARNMVGQALYDCQGHKGLKPEEFIGVTENGNTRLGELESDAATTGFVNLVTAVNCKGSSSDFDYVMFGIVFYDFEAVPVAANGLHYIHGSLGTAVNDKGSNESVVSNGQQQDIVHSAVLGDSVTETTSTTISAMASAKASENIGANVGWKETQSGSDTEFEFGEDGFSSSSSGWSEETSMGLNWGAAWELAGAAGAEQGHSQSKEISKAAQTTIALPAHTAATINHVMTTTTYSQTYQQPVILNYKVALFAVSGDYYTGGEGGINPSSYEKQSLVIKLDTKSESSPTYGCAATDDLYSRVITNKQVANYDVADGRTYETHSSVSGWTKSEDINWDSVIAVARDYYDANVVGNVAKTNYIFEMLGKLNVDKDKTTSTVESMYPLYGLSSVKTPKTNYVMFLGNDLDRSALSVQGYNRFDVPFYGFNSQWGEWNRCDENGTIVNGGLLFESDPVEVTDQGTIKAKADGNGGTIYLTWVIEDQNAKPKTAESPDGQNLAASNISCPVVRIDVVNAGLDDPSITAKGSWTGFYGNSVNLNNVMEYEVTDNTDKILETQVKWESREPSSSGIFVNASTGNVTFMQPGTFHVRPYVINNSDKKVYSDWLTVTAAEHDMTHYAAQTPTCTADGCNEHYKCADCGKYFSDADGKNEIPAADVIIAATGHDWGEWTTIKQVSGDTPGEQRRVCKNDASHEEPRALYTVQFNMNGHGTPPETQAVAKGTSMTVPEEPTAAGYTFGGWFTDESCTTSYDFGTTVKGNLTLYAKWSPAKYMVAAVAVGDVYKDEAGEQKVYPVAQGSIEIDGGSLVTDTDGYTYSYKEVEYGTPITLKVKPNENYGLKDIKAATVNAAAKTGDPFTPEKTGATTYSLTVTDADVAVVASFSQVTITYDGNAPANATVSDVPEAAKIAYGSRPTKPKDPKITGTSGAEYVFGGWCTDRECTKPFLFNSTITQDMTLYAKWIQTSAAQFKVKYTLYDLPGSDPASYSDSLIVEDKSYAYDPTADLYSEADKDLLKGYELQKDAASGSCWFTDEDCTTPFNFTTPITADTQLYAKIVPRTFTVTYFNGNSRLGTQGVAYNTAINTVSGVETPIKAGYVLGWITDNGAPWDIETTPVTGDMNLYANWSIGRYTVTFDANGHGKAPVPVTADYNTTMAEPAAPTADGYTFGGWFTSENDGATLSETPYDFDTPVTASMTLYAKWTPNKYTVTFDANGHGAAPAEATPDYNTTVTEPTVPTADGYTFGDWFKEAACTNKWDFAKDKVTGNTTLYAKWTPNKYDVNVNGLVGKGSITATSDNGPITSESKQVEYGSTVTLTVTPGKDSTGEYGLKSVTVTADSGPLALTKTASDTYTFTMPAEPVTVSAEFSQITIDYRLNSPEATGDLANAPGTRYYAYGSVPAEPPAPTFTGGSQKWVFGGWYTDAAFTTPYLFSFPETSNQTLHGEWIKADEQRTVTYTIFDVPGSDPVSYSSDDIVAKGSRAYNPTTQVKNYITRLASASEYKYYGGYELYSDAGNYWFTDEACTTPYDFSTQVTQDTHLYAKLMPKSYTVTYLAEKGASTALTTAAFDYGTAIGDKAPKPKKDGHVLSGWKNAASAGGEESWDLSAPITGDLTLYPAWVANNYTITFDANGHGTAPVSQTKAYGEKVVKPNDLEEEGYTFGGWFTDPDCTDAYDFNAGVASDMRLYALMTQDVCTVEFVTFTGTNPAPQEVAQGDKATEPADAPTFEGYTFGGWFTSIDGGATLSTEPYDFDTPVTKNTTLYAKWTVNEYAVAFDANGHGTAPAAQTVKYGDKATKPADLTATGYVFGGWFTDAACTKAYDFGSAVEGDLTLYAKWTAEESDEPEPEVKTQEMYRLYNPNSGEHFYTASAEERDGVVEAGWQYEGVGWLAPVTSSTPVFRLYSGTDHHYTTSEKERGWLVGLGWKYEGIGWYSDDAQGVPLYRQYNPNAYALTMAGSHNYTIDKDENDLLVSLGWQEEGIGWYGVATQASGSEKATAQDLVAAAI